MDLNDISCDENVCGVCEEAYKDPRVVSCLHVYCLSCIDKQSCEKTKVFQCKTCQQTTTLSDGGAASLPRDYVRVNRLDLSAIVSTKPMCTSCRQRDKAIAYCNVCFNFLCVQCNTAHQNINCFHDHKVVLFSDLDENKPVMIHSPIMCTKHKVENLKLFCHTCQNLLCNECTTTHSGDHKVERVSDIEHAQIDEVKSLLKEGQERIRICDDGLGELQLQIDGSKSCINEIYQSLKASIEKQRVEMLKKLEEKHKEQRLSIMESLHKSEGLMGKMEDSCNYTEKLLKHANNPEILSVKKVVTERLKDLISVAPKLDNSVDLNYTPEMTTREYIKALKREFDKEETPERTVIPTCNKLVNGSIDDLLNPVLSVSISNSLSSSRSGSLSSPEHATLQEKPTGSSFAKANNLLVQSSSSRPNGFYNGYSSMDQGDIFQSAWASLANTTLAQATSSLNFGNQAGLDRSKSLNEAEYSSMNSMGLNGFGGSNTLNGLGGSLSLNGLDANDTLCSNSSLNSTLNGLVSNGLGSSGTLNGLGNNSTLNGLGNNSTLNGLGNNSTLNGLGNNSTLNGLGSNSTLNGLGSNSTLNGLGSNSTLNGLGSNNTLNSLGNNLNGLANQVAGVNGLNGMPNTLSSNGFPNSLPFSGQSSQNEYNLYKAHNRLAQSSRSRTNGSDPFNLSLGHMPSMTGPPPLISPQSPSGISYNSRSAQNKGLDWLNANKKNPTGRNAWFPPAGRSAITGNCTPMQVRMTFGRPGNRPGEFDSPSGFCLGLDEDIVVADMQNHRIQIFSMDGIYKYQFGQPGKSSGYLHLPRKVAVIKSCGRFVVCDQGDERSRMQIFDRGGKFLKKISLRFVSVVSGLAVTEEGYILVVDSSVPALYKMDQLGETRDCVQLENYMREPSEITISPSGKQWYVCDFKGHSVVVLSSSGQVLSRMSSNYTHFPVGIAVSDAGDILVGDSHGNKFHITLFSKTGLVVAEYECPEMKVSRCSGLHITSKGYIITISKHSQQVIMLNTLFIK